MGNSFSLHIGKAHGYVLISAAAFIIERDGGKALAEAYHLVFARGAKAFSERDIIYRLQKIGLSLSVVSVENVYTAVKEDAFILGVPKIAKLYFFADHINP